MQIVLLRFMYIIFNIVKLIFHLKGLLTLCTNLSCDGISGLCRPFQELARAKFGGISAGQLPPGPDTCDGGLRILVVQARRLRWTYGSRAGSSSHWRFTSLIGHQIKIQVQRSGGLVVVPLAFIVQLRGFLIERAKWSQGGSFLGQRLHHQRLGAGHH